MVNECVILADDPSALVELCGISTLERLLRTLQRCGIERATVLSSTPDPIAKELARPSWARAQLHLTLRTRPAGPVRLEQIVDLWPRSSDAIPLLLVIPAGSVFDPQLLRALVSQNAPTVLVDSGVGATDSGPHRFRAGYFPRETVRSSSFGIRLGFGARSVGS